MIRIWKIPPPGDETDESKERRASLTADETSKSAPQSRGTTNGSEMV